MKGDLRKGMSEKGQTWNGDREHGEIGNHDE